MKSLFFLLSTLFLSLNLLAQETKTLPCSTIAVVTLQDGTVLEGNLYIDFEQHSIQITNPNAENSTITTRQLAFSALQTITMYDKQTHLRREFISLKYNELYEVILAGEVALLRYYHKNPHCSNATQAEVSYFLYKENSEKVVSVGNIAQEMHNIFAENTALIQHIIQNKHYDLDNLQHIASILRYQNQCKAKAIAKQ
jgi:hypothetical protein